MNRICLMVAAIGIAALSLTAPAQAGTSDVELVLPVSESAQSSGARSPRKRCMSLHRRHPSITVPPPAPVFYGGLIYGPPAFRYHYRQHRNR